MLTILSDNENLLERLELMTQNMSKPQNKNIFSPIKAQSLLIGQLNTNLTTNNENLSIVQLLAEPNILKNEQNKKECCRNWIILIGKRNFDESQQAIETFSDLFRLSLAMRDSISNKSLKEKDEPTMRILIAKKEHSDNDEHFLRDKMDEIRRNWTEQWGNGQLERLRRFGESNALNEQIERTKQWMDESKEIGDLCCALAYFDEPEFMTTINNFFQFDESGFEILDSFDQVNDFVGQRQLFTKPPALHWTNYPRESDVQITFKFVFPKGTIPEWIFRDWIKMAKEQVEWSYKYEWNNGVLLRADELVKITLIRLQGDPNIIELSGRIDAEEELQERKESNEQQIENGLECNPPSSPLKRVWPYLIQIFEPLLEEIESYKTLPFNLYFVFIGDCFFNCPEDAQKLTARSLDAIQTLSSIQRIKLVRFKADQDKIYSLDLNQCFADFRPTKMSDFSSINYPLPKQEENKIFEETSPLLFSSSSTSDEPATCATSLEDSRVQSPRTLTEKKRVDRSPSCFPLLDSRIEQINTSSTSASPQPQNCLNVVEGGQGYKNRGRRVSFGIIHSIPNTDSASSPLLMNISSNFPLSGERKNEDSIEEKPQNEEENNINKSALVVENIVDEMLKKAIDQVFISNE